MTGTNASAALDLTLIIVTVITSLGGIGVAYLTHVAKRSAPPKSTSPHSHPHPHPHPTDRTDVILAKLDLIAARFEAVWNEVRHRR